jgi:hypothetical protein
MVFDFFFFFFFFFFFLLFNFLKVSFQHFKIMVFHIKTSFLASLESLRWHIGPTFLPNANCLLFAMAKGLSSLAPPWYLKQGGFALTSWAWWYGQMILPPWTL